jgi:hypothetical protein
MKSKFTRRQAIKQISAAGVTVSTGSFLAGCGPAGDDASQSLSTSSDRSTKAVTGVTNVVAVAGISSIEITATVAFNAAPQLMFADIRNADYSTAWTLPASNVQGSPPAGTWKGKQEGLLPGLYHSRIWTGAAGTYTSFTLGPDVIVTGTSITAVSNVTAVGGPGQLTIAAQVAFSNPAQKLFASIANADYSQVWELPASSLAGAPPSASWSTTKNDLPAGLYHTRVWWSDNGNYASGYTQGPDVMVVDAITALPYTDLPHNFEIVGTWAPVTARMIATYPGAQTFDVGPGKQYTEVHQVPWLTAPLGSVMNIHFRSTPYRSIIVHHHAANSEAQRYIINGVTDSQGRRPYLSGRNAVYEAAVLARRATTPTYLANEAQLGQVIACKENSSSPIPSYITIKNLDIFDSGYGVPVNGISSVAKNPFTQIPISNSTWDFTSAVWSSGVENLKIENCNLHDSGGGVFINSNNGVFSRNIVLRNNKIWNTGKAPDLAVNERGDKEHGTYCAAIGILYEGNDYGRTRTAALGGSLKDRSSNCVIRANRISVNARAIDLVEDQSSKDPIAAFSPIFFDPSYNTPWVYCNVIHYQKKDDRDAGGLFNLGADGLTVDRRTGQFYFFNNTVICERKSFITGYHSHVIFDQEGEPSSDPGFVDHDNVYISIGNWGDTRLLRSEGRVTRTGKIYQSWGQFTYPNISGTGVVVTNGSVLTTGSTFDTAFRPVGGSNVIGQSTAATWQVGHEPTVMWSMTSGVVPRLASIKSIGALEPA